MSGKYVQIMPAPNNLYAIYEDEGEEIESRIVMFALSEDGDITMLDMDKNGWLDEAITACNFKRVEYR
ncbi:pathogenicity island protein [Staphylococcus simulans]|uniref:pathogenicity island protein n=1 Tax=Staphylococcus simulans TaxID=1286 RepID=UPI0021D0E043|nr:pathogenicity island protein [Staphylococcus simulans]UXR29858.1 pathogenicity island protein [Staphylococcus simulans]